MRYYLRACLIALIVNSLLVWLPIAPLLIGVGGFFGAFYLERQILYHHLRPSSTDKISYTILVGLFQAGIFAYILLLLLYFFIMSPDVMTENSWFHFRQLDGLLFHSVGFKVGYFLCMSMICFVSHSVGCMMAFGGLGRRFAPEEAEIMSRMSLTELETYLEE